MKLVAALLVCAGLAAAQPSEEKAVLAVVERLFDAMAARDAAAARALVVPEGRYYSLRGANPPIGATLADFADRLQTLQDPIKETMRDPEVRIRGRLATVWTHYDFYRSGKRTHGGIDSFTLVKYGRTWRVAGLVYTVE
jgi:hypothetical protein